MSKMKKFFIDLYEDLYVMFWCLAKTLRWALRVAATLGIITYTAAPIYEAWLQLAATRSPGAADWVLGDLSVLFTIFTYLMGYGMYELIMIAFKSAGEYSDKKDAKRAKAQDQAQIKASDKTVSQA